MFSLSEISRLPSVALSTRSKLPNASGVYIVISKQSILYVGETKNINTRWAGHNKGVDIALAIGDAQIAYYLCDEAERKNIELQLIQKFNPAFNKNGKKNGKTAAKKNAGSLNKKQKLLINTANDLGFKNLMASKTEWRNDDPDLILFSKRLRRRRRKLSIDAGKNETPIMICKRVLRLLNTKLVLVRTERKLGRQVRVYKIQSLTPSSVFPGSPPHPAH